MDRCLSKSFVRGLKTFGFDVVSLHDIYGDDGTTVDDVTWIRDSAAHHYLAFTSNPKIWFVQHERAAILDSGAKVFSIANAQQSRDGKALVFGRHILSIARRRDRPGPCFWRLTPDGVTYDLN